MRKYLALFLFIFSLPVFALSGPTPPAGWNNLSDAQRAEISRQVAVTVEENVKQAAPAAATAALADPKKLDEWLTLGEHMGKMMGGAAKEVGVAVNDFVNTPVGQMTMVLVVWKYMGGTLVHVVGGLLVWALGVLVVGFLYRRMRDTTIEYNKEVRNWFGNHPRVRVQRPALSSGEVSNLFYSAAFFLLVGLVTMFTF